MTFLQTHGKHIILCKISDYLGIEGNKAADRVAKKNSRDVESDHNQIIFGHYKTRNSKLQRRWKTSASKAPIIKKCQYEETRD